MSKSYLKQDEEIRAFAAGQHVNTSGTYNNRVLLAIEEGKSKTGQSQRKINFYGKLAVACACACIITMSGVGVHAAINYANQRMEQVTDGEKEQFISDVNESQASADSYSRPLTDVEKSRLDELKEEYESKGVYPEESILEIKDSSQIDSSRICFEPDTSTFYLPERELTDEEMLELIDFYNIRDNVLSEQKTEAVYDMTGVDEITEEEAKSIAKGLLQKLYGADTDNMKVEVDYQQGTDGEESFSTDYLYFTDEETGEQCEVSVDLQSAKAGSVAKIAAESPYADNLKPDEALYKSQYETADKMASAFLGNTEAWKDSKITYLVSDDGSVRNGVVNYEFTAQSGESCIVSYSQSLGQMYKVRYFTEENLLKKDNDVRSNLNIVIIE